MVKTGTIQDKPICSKLRKSKEMKRAATATALKGASTSVILADIEINSDYPDKMNAASPPNLLRVLE
jgi:predicted methyltransferase MtxX (methanogen marker protein 4)